MELAIWLLRIGPALTMIAFGIHQTFINPEPWREYFPKFLEKILPFDSTMRVHGIGNILIGLFLISSLYPLIAAWIALIWWLSILPFAFLGSWKSGMRDFAINCALAALVALLSI